MSAPGNRFSPPPLPKRLPVVRRRAFVLLLVRLRVITVDVVALLRLLLVPFLLRRMLLLFLIHLLPTLLFRRLLLVDVQQEAVLRLLRATLCLFLETRHPRCLPEALRRFR